MLFLFFVLEPELFQLCFQSVDFVFQVSYHDRVVLARLIESYLSDVGFLRAKHAFLSGFFCFYGFIHRITLLSLAHLKALDCISKADLMLLDFFLQLFNILLLAEHLLL